MPTEYTVDQKKDLFRETYGEQWLRYWNLVHQNGKTRSAFARAVTSTPPSRDSPESAQSLADQQMALFKQVFGDEWQQAWSAIMQDTDVKQRFTDMFRVRDSSYDDGANSDVRGPGLPPPPPLPQSQTASAQRQNLFSDVFGEGEGLALEMKIFGDKQKRNMFASAFSNFLKENMQRAVADKREQWEDDMMQLMTDALGADGPKVLRDIYADPQRAGLFRQAFAGYLEETPSDVATLMQVDEGHTAPGLTSPAHTHNSQQGRRVVPPPL